MASTFMNEGSAPQHSIASLPSLQAHHQSEGHIATHLASRYHARLPTAQLSSHGFISLNTYTSPDIGPNGDREGSAAGAAEDLARRAFQRLGHRAENQAVVFLGESGSGKTTIRTRLVSSFLSFSSTPLSRKISYAAFVFDTLTTTKSTVTPTASKAGLYLELQYDTASSTHPTLLGGKILDHRLERSRVASVPTGERNFHILYYLLAGTSDAEKQHLGLDDPGMISSDANKRASLVAGAKRWRYLGHPAQLKVGVDDVEGFKQFKEGLKALEFPRSEIAEICQILAAILHIGQLEFMTTQATMPSGDDSGGFSHEGGEDVTVVKNKDTLKIISAFLGVGMHDLEMSLGYKTKTLHRERVTVMLDPHGARDNADELAQTIYTLLVAYIVESINSRICAVEDMISNTISIVDFPGFSHVASTGSTLDQLFTNAANESLYNICLQSFYEKQAEMLDAEEVQVPEQSYFDNSDAVKGLLKSGNGLLSILDDQMRRGKTDTQFLDAVRKRFNEKNPAISASSTTAVLPGSNFATHNAAASFTVRHFAGEVEYPVEGVLDENGEIISGDLMNLINSTKSDFVRELFGQEALTTVVHPKERTAIMQATISSKPMRMPSMARRKNGRAGRNAKQLDVFHDDETASQPSNPRSNAGTMSGTQQGAAAQFLSSLMTIKKSLSGQNTNPYFVFCIKPNDRRLANKFDTKAVRNQIATFGIVELSQRLRNVDLSIFLPFHEFLSLAQTTTLGIGSEKDQAQSIVEDKRWPGNEARVGSTGVFLSERVWFDIANLPGVGIGDSQHYRGAGTETDDEGVTPGATPSRGFGGSRLRLLDSHTPSPGAFYHDDKQGGYFGHREMDVKSEAGVSALGGGDMFRNLETREHLAEKGNEVKMEAVEEIKTSGSRKRWMFLVWMLTFYVPDFLIRLVGRMPRKDIRVAWREKFAINLMIWLSCAFVVFFMIGFPALICPTQHVYSSAELSSYDGKGKHGAYIAIRGVVYDLAAFAPLHYPKVVPTSALKKYAGKDATNLFPVQVSALCRGTEPSVGIDDAVQLNYVNSNYTGQSIVVSTTDLNAQYHDFRWFRNDSRPDWWWEQQEMLKANYQKGRIGYTPKYIKKLASKQNSIAILNDKIYDFTAYIPGGRQPRYKDGEEAPAEQPNSNFMDQRVVTLFQSKAGEDVTKYWLNLDLSPELRSSMQHCLDNLFYVGDVDTRNSAQCLFATYILLAVSILLVSVIGAKFLAALQFGKKNIPENLDKFVICTIPVYTEDEDSVRRAIDSAARMRYDDKRKLMVIICDGMIIGQGNDRPTPRIVLDVLGVSEHVDPEPLSFESLGEGMKQHNMGKVYSGLYEVSGHIVPFLVIVKVGRPSEVQKPGNRGKRDSQMVLMRFLSRVHYNEAMTPMELEMHHQIRNIIGVNPTFYEFLFQIDADTVVAQDSATRMISQFLSDTRIIGVCGETALTNAKESIITMIQVYEYYISHNLTKAFESLFGSVTCLPGCFSMYRIRAAETGKPLFVSREVVTAYSEIRVDTLHMKNLLHLGEDRYLTTLLLKYHSKYKTKYNFRSHAWTIAPDSWTVFMSQRRRWINSTVHNLIELIPLQQLCGFCCFSMRFVVFLDLLSTVVQPVIVGYIAYLIYLLVNNSSLVPVTAFILLGAIYGLQAIIFILRRKWEMIGWMIIYVLATPVFACGLPLYAFWHMDDFSWGNTRVVTGEKGQKVVISDEGKFDPNSIPKKRWEEYQAELWEAQTQRDDRSEVSGISYATKSFAGHHAGPASSEYGGLLAPGAGYSPQSRPMSQLEIPRHGSRLSLAPSGYGGLATDMEMSELNGQVPSDDQLLAEIRDIVRTADVMSVTKRGVRKELERRFGVPLDSKREFISSATESTMLAQMQV